MKSQNIIYENGKYWIGKIDNSYTVFKIGVTHSTSDSSYSMDEDGLSIAIRRCDYLAKSKK